MNTVKAYRINKYFRAKFIKSPGLIDEPEGTFDAFASIRSPFVGGDVFFFFNGAIIEEYLINIAGNYEEVDLHNDHVFRAGMIKVLKNYNLSRKPEKRWLYELARQPHPDDCHIGAVKAMNEAADVHRTSLASIYHNESAGFAIKLSTSFYVLAQNDAGADIKYDLASVFAREVKREGKSVLKIARNIIREARTIGMVNDMLYDIIIPTTRFLTSINEDDALNQVEKCVKMEATMEGAIEQMQTDYDLLTAPPEPDEAAPDPAPEPDPAATTPIDEAPAPDVSGGKGA